MNDSNKPLISICVGAVTAKTLPYLVESIINQQFRDWELILAIQGNEQELIYYVTQQAQKDTRISFIHLTRFGKCYAINEAVKKAKAEIIAFTDHDCVAPENWLSTIYSCFSTDQSVGIVAGSSIHPPARPFRVSTCCGASVIECVYRPNEENGFTAPPGFYWGGGNFAVRRSVVDLVGPFDEYFGPGTEFPACEDVDFCLRAEVLGVVMWTTPKLFNYHKFGRRYGIKNFLKYHQGFALASGALVGKLYLWDHRLAKEWGKKRSTAEWLKDFIINPLRALRDIYKSKYSAIGYSTYLSKYKIDENILSCLKIVKQG